MATSQLPVHCSQNYPNEIMTGNKLLAFLKSLMFGYVCIVEWFTVGTHCGTLTCCSPSRSEKELSFVGWGIVNIIADVGNLLFCC